jgi:hypothetical protein
VQTLDLLFGASGVPGYTDDSSVGDLLSTLDEGDMDGEGNTGDDISAAADNELVKLVNKIIIDAYQPWALRTSTSSLAWARTSADPFPQGRLAAAHTSKCRPATATPWWRA